MKAKIIRRLESRIVFAPLKTSMISIIISSINETLLAQVSQSISQSIGVEYEIIHIEKTVNQSGICHAYNEGARRSKYAYLCFVHDDVKFLTNGWGMNIINHFESDKEIGLIGVAGGICKTKMVSMWHEGRLRDVSANRVNIIQHFRNGEKPEHFYDNPCQEVQSRVVVIDGVFMAARREVWQCCQFDSFLLKRFHAYDLDFSLQVCSIKKVIVVYDVLIEHFSEGRADIGFMEDYFTVHRKWKKALPVILPGYQWDRDLCYINGWQLLKQSLNRLMSMGIHYRRLMTSYLYLLSLMDVRPVSVGFLIDAIKVGLAFTKHYFGLRVSAVRNQLNS